MPVCHVTVAFDEVTVPVARSPSKRTRYRPKGNATAPFGHITITVGKVTIPFHQCRPSLSRHRLSWPSHHPSWPRHHPSWTCHCHSGHAAVPVCHVIVSMAKSPSQLTTSSFQMHVSVSVEHVTVSDSISPSQLTTSPSFWPFQSNWPRQRPIGYFSVVLATLPSKRSCHRPSWARHNPSWPRHRPLGHVTVPEAMSSS